MKKDVWVSRTKKALPWPELAERARSHLVLYIVCSPRPAASRLYKTKITLAARIWWLRESSRESLRHLLEATQLWCVVEPSSLAPEFISLTSLLSCLSELSLK